MSEVHLYTRGACSSMRATHKAPPTSTVMPTIQAQPDATPRSGGPTRHDHRRALGIVLRSVPGGRCFV
jgi:hypothetical protein